jgi:L-threonylcarbamoyladenylate synthase
MAQIGQDIIKAKQLLEEGKLVAIPTETVYGLAANALNPEAALEIFRVKQRPAFDPLIAHTDSLEKAETFVRDIPQKAQILAKHFWPGPLTILFDKQSIIPDIVTSGLDRVAVRIPSHQLTLDLLKSIDFPLAAPSANPFGYVSPTEAKHVNDNLGEKIPYILDGGPCEIGLESTIVGFENNETIIYRLGGMSLDQIQDLIGDVKININKSSNPKAPGMLKSHYAPSIPVRIINLKEDYSLYDPNSTGVISFQKLVAGIPEDNQFVLSESGDLGEAARNLFKALRTFEEKPIKLLITELLPEKGLGLAINDRLKRAAASA